MTTEKSIDGAFGTIASIAKFDHWKQESPKARNMFSFLRLFSLAVLESLVSIVPTDPLYKIHLRCIETGFDVQKAVLKATDLIVLSDNGELNVRTEFVKNSKSAFSGGKKSQKVKKLVIKKDTGKLPKVIAAGNDREMDLETKGEKKMKSYKQSIKVLFIKVTAASKDSPESISKCGIKYSFSVEELARKLLAELRSLGSMVYKKQALCLTNEDVFVALKMAIPNFRRDSHVYDQALYPKKLAFHGKRSLPPHLRWLAINGCKFSSKQKMTGAKSIGPVHILNMLIGMRKDAGDKDIKDKEKLQKFNTLKAELKGRMISSTQKNYVDAICKGEITPSHALKLVQSLAVCKPRMKAKYSLPIAAWKGEACFGPESALAVYNANSVETSCANPHALVVAMLDAYYEDEAVVQAMCGSTGKPARRCNIKKVKWSETEHFLCKKVIFYAPPLKGSPTNLMEQSSDTVTGPSINVERKRLDNYSLIMQSSTKTTVLDLEIEMNDLHKKVEALECKNKVFTKVWSDTTKSFIIVGQQPAIVPSGMHFFSAQDQ